MESTEELTGEARNLARDGILFGAVGLTIVGVIVVTNVSSFFGADERHAIAFLTMAGSSALVLTVTSIIKFARAKRAGSETLGLSHTSYAILKFCGALGLLATGTFVSIVLACWFGADVKLVSCTAPLLITCWMLARCYSRAKTPERACAYALGASLVFLCYVWALLGWRSVLFGIGNSPKLNEILTSRARVWWVVCLGAGQSGLTCLAVSGISRYRALQSKAHGASQILTRLYLRALLCGLVISALSIAGLRLSNYWLLASLILLFPVALKVARLLSRLKHPGPISRARSMLFIMPMLLVMLFMVEIAGLAGSCVDFVLSKASASEFNTRRDWVWYSPEVVRGPIARQMARINDASCRWANFCSMLSIEELECNATGKSSVVGHLAWWGWRERDPDAALAKAREVSPAALGCLLANSPYDHCAGFTLGKLGSIEEVRRRLDGTYSREFVSGMLWGSSKERLQKLTHELTLYCQSDRAGAREWDVFAREFPNEATNVVQTAFNHPAADRYALVEHALSTGCFDALEKRALESHDVNLRKIAFRQSENYYYLTQKENALPLITLLIDAANGTLPNTDDNERRGATRVLAKRIGVELAPSELADSDGCLSDVEQVLLIKTLSAAQDYCVVNASDQTQ